MKQYFVLTMLSLILLSGCSTSPTGRSQLAFMPEAEVNKMGLQTFDQLKKQKPVEKSAQDNAFVRCISDAITKETGGEWEVVVFRDETLNAFALPGKKIGVHTGLIKLVDNQSQLAAVMGHEVGHVLARHSNERLSHQVAVKTGMTLAQAVAVPQSQLGQAALGLLGVGAEYGVILPFSRTHESEADMIGLSLMAKAGFDPRESAKLWVKMGAASKGKKSPEFLSTHPSHETRIKDLTKKIPEALKIQQQAKSQGKSPQCDRLRR